MNHRSRAVSHDVWDRDFLKEHRQWCDNFIIELRLRDVPGTQIGDRLAEVEAHCTEAGQSPTVAFGDPVEYARELTSQHRHEPASGVWTVTLISVAQVLALLVGSTAAWSWAAGEQMSYNVVQVGALVVLTALLLALPVLLRPLVQRPWSVGLPLLLLTVLAGLGSAAGGALDLPALLTLPAATVTIALFVVVLALAAAELRVLSGEDDRIVSPLDATPARPMNAWHAWVPVLIIPVGYIVFAGIALVAG